MEHCASTIELQNRDLDVFASRVAHDLKGPLTTIKLVGAVLAKPSSNGPMVARLQRSTVHMERIIDDLLTFSRATGVQRVGAADPASVAAEVREDLAHRLEAEHVTMRLAVAPAAVKCPEGLLRQVPRISRKTR